MIPVTRPFLPPKGEYEIYLKEIYERNWLTNDGPLLRELEKGIKEYVKTDNFTFLSNGTLALQLAFKALSLRGEVITTPFSYIATASSLVWEGLKPVFVDIDEETWNINPENIERAITTETTAIVATHVFGIPCDIRSIQEIGQKYQLKVIFDASHCFGVVWNGQSIFNYGDISTASFHATKLYHSVEGGGVFSSSQEIDQKIKYFRNFGHDGFDQYNGVGINAKNSEFHAAMGLINLRYIGKIIEERKLICGWYDSLLSQNIKKLEVPIHSTHNFAYYPLVFESEKQCLAIKSALEIEEIYPRRYFFPLLSSIPYMKSKKQFPSAERISSQILCLPLYNGLQRNNVELVSSIVNRFT